MALHVAKISLRRYSCYRDHCRSRDTRGQIRPIRGATGNYGRTKYRRIHNDRSNARIFVANFDCLV